MVIFLNAAKTRSCVKTSYAFKLFRRYSSVYDIKQSKGKQNFTCVYLIGYHLMCPIYESVKHYWSLKSHASVQKQLK